MNDAARQDQGFPISAGILFGLGLGGFFDGIVLHQILQWHHLLTSAGYPPDSVENLKVNTFWDGTFTPAPTYSQCSAFLFSGGTPGRTTSAGPASSFPGRS